MLLLQSIHKKCQNARDILTFFNLFRNQDYSPSGNSFCGV